MEQNQVNSADTLRRVDKLERDLSTLTDKVINLSDLAVQTNTNVENLINQVGNLFNKTQPKPTNWSVVIAALSLTALIGAMALTPLYKSDAEQKQFDQYMMKHLEKDAREMGELETNVKWVMKLEERLNNRIHKGVQ